MVKSDEIRGSFFSSWSGGKDSTLAFFKAAKEGLVPAKLFTVFDADGSKSRAHGFGKDIVALQSEALGVESRIESAGWGEYEEKLVEFMKDCKRSGIGYGVFGDIDLLAHREWLERVCGRAGIEPLFPLWNMDRKKVVEEFIESGFKAMVVSCRKDCGCESFLGRELDMALVAEMESRGIDVAGENGEYHTVVLDGPLFDHKIEVEVAGRCETEKSVCLNLRPL